MMKRVFVSSTLIDLREYRMRVQEVIRQLGAIDISMEHFGARDERPKDECLRLIREESNLFVGIYAHRYGFIPNGDQKSITEQEYDAATNENLARFIYIIDDDAAWKPAYIDKDVLAEKLMRFKAKLKASHTCKYFSNQDQLASFVAADLGRHLTGSGVMQSSNSFKVGDSAFEITKEDVQKTFVNHAGRMISVENLALIRNLSQKIFDERATDEEIIEWFYLLPNTVSPFEETISERSRVYINGQPLESPTPLEIYNAIVRHKEKKSNANDEGVIKRFIDITRSVKRDHLEVLYGYFGNK